MNPTFEKWCEKLLDTGKGNRLINYKESKARNLKILRPSTQEVFNKLLEGKTLSFFDIDSYIERLKSTALPEERDMVEENLTLDKILNDVLRLLKPTDMLAYTKGTPLKKILKNLKKISQNSLVEKGINILYLSFGFLSWTTPVAPHEKFISPLVLVPIKLEQDTAHRTYNISLYEDEYNVNPTLIYKLKSEYNISLPDFREETHENEGIDEYILRLSRFVNDLKWTTTDGISIGTYSFMKLNMYKDLKENETTVLSNNTVRQLLNLSTTDIKQTPIDVDTFFKEGREVTLHNVVDADSSQISAIVKAKAGESFVLQGPPGTGKSQTITNIIAEFLYENKKVLFVSEKLAALNVVYNNMKKAGLHDFCLELHSNKVNKKDVIQELYRALSSNKKFVNLEASDETREFTQAKGVLDSYYTDLHRPQEKVNKSVYEIINEISRYPDIKPIEYAIEGIETKDSEHLKNSIEVLQDYIKHLGVIGTNYKDNIWYGYINQDSTYKAKVDLKKNLNTLREFISDLNLISLDLKTYYDIDVTSIEKTNTTLGLLKVIATLSEYYGLLFNKQTLEKLSTLLKDYNTKVSTLKEYREIVSKVYTPSVYEIALGEYYLRYRNKYSSTFTRIFSGKYKEDKRILKSYQIDTDTKLKYKETLRLLDYARSVPLLESAIQKLEIELTSILITKPSINYTQFEKEIVALNDTMTESISKLQNISKEEFVALQNHIKNYIHTLESNIEKYDRVVELQKSFDVNIFNILSTPFDNISYRIDAMIENIDSIENWLRFLHTLQSIDNLGLNTFIDECINTETDMESIDKMYHVLYYTQWLYHIVDKSESLHRFSRLHQDQMLSKFKSKDKLYFDIVKAKIIAKLNQNMPNVNNMASGSQVSILTREANKKSRLKPVRVLLKEIGELIQTLKPCFLMSPLSVSTYLDQDSVKFDVVIFDEASQIFPWDSIGAIYRAQQVIIVGDSKQMPPSNFFTATIDTDDEYSEDMEDDSLDFESILDLSSAILPQTRLNWHYRSKTEELIAFSNTHFYENTLVTFPASNKNTVDMGVDFHYVEGGLFDRTSKTNRKEAEYIVKLVFEHFDKHPERSLGVVAFSISQQDIIEDLIQDYREKDNKYEKYFDSTLKEPFFVKNLETVQGDERDTIIFSVAYAKDKNNKFYHNFGPLNKKGGERRLNVAVTRAKCNVKLVASIKSTDIDLSKTESIGAKLLKEYLYYAENNINLNKDISKNEDQLSPMLKEVCKCISKAGYTYDTRLGYSDHKIDIAVKHKAKPHYTIAIECDGNTYTLGKTTRDRNRTREGVLSGLGWKYYRLWSMEWFTNKETEKQKLLQAIAKSMEDEPKNTNASSTKQSTTNFLIEQEVTKTDSKNLFKKYIHYDTSHMLFPYYETLYRIIKLEGPITEDLLLEKSLDLLNRSKVTDVVKQTLKFNLTSISNKVSKVEDYYIVDRDKPITLRVPKDNEKPRSILHIPISELASGMYTLIKNNIGIKKDGLYSTISTLLGFGRPGKNMTARLDLALNKLIKENSVRVDGDEYFIV